MKYENSKVPSIAKLDLTQMKKSELMELAKTIELAGRSKMKVAELREALIEIQNEYNSLIVDKLDSGERGHQDILNENYVEKHLLEIIDESPEVQEEHAASFGEKVSKTLLSRGLSPIYIANKLAAQYNVIMSNLLVKHGNKSHLWLETSYYGIQTFEGVGSRKKLISIKGGFRNPIKLAKATSNKRIKEEVENSERIVVNSRKVLNLALRVLEKENHEGILAFALALTSGRRQSELFASNFKLNEDGTIHCDQLAKKKKRTSFNFKVLVNPDLWMSAYNRFVDRLINKPTEHSQVNEYTVHIRKKHGKFMNWLRRELPEFKSFHDSRDFYVSYRYEREIRGKDLENLENQRLLMDLAGHSKIESTNNYTRMSFNDLNKNV